MAADSINAGPLDTELQSSAADLVAVLMSGHLRTDTDTLGYALATGVEVALAARDPGPRSHRAWVLCGDAELGDGPIWEAFQRAGRERLDNLIVIIDINRLGQTREAMLGWDIDGYRARFSACGWRVIEIHGHDVCQIDSAYKSAEVSDGRPTAILARTRKHRGLRAVADPPV